VAIALMNKLTKCNLDEVYDAYSDLTPDPFPAQNQLEGRGVGVDIISLKAL
jgi:hypothetical protein